MTVERLAPSPGHGALQLLARRMMGSRLFGPLRRRLLFLRPAASSMGLVAPLPDDLDQEASLVGWSAPQLLQWYLRPAVSGAPRQALRNAERILATKGLRDRNLFLNIGSILLDHGEPAGAVKAYAYAYEADSESRYHYGQRLFDHLASEPRSRDELLTIVSLGSDPNRLVPDLAKLLLGQLLAPPAADPSALDRSALRSLAACMSRGALLEIGNQSLAAGAHSAAMTCYGLSMQSDPRDIHTRLQMGVTEYLANNYAQAEAHFAIMDSMRRAQQAHWGVADLPVTVMDPTWSQAIGHIACLDTYVKSMELGWQPKQRSVMGIDIRNPPLGWPLLKYWGRHIEILGSSADPADVIDNHIWRTTDDLGRSDRDQRRASLMSTFWCGPDAEGKIRYYAPLGSEVQHAWKAQGRAPLLSMDEDERVRFRILMEQAFGLPRDAWFVLLHVREGGYKADWEKTHAYTRNADVDTYDEAIEHIIERGGWVVRGGDPSMRPVRPRPGLIDYATSSFRSPELDIQLCAECRCFLGTNSGFSLVPPLFGKRCVLTNWSPLGTPNWYPDDIFIPKLVRRRGSGELLTFKEMYGSMAGWSQFQRDFQGEFEVVDNSPDDLLAAAGELLDEMDGRFSLSPSDAARLDRFRSLTVAGGGYPGSRLGARFAERYEQLL